MGVLGPRRRGGEQFLDEGGVDIQPRPHYMYVIHTVTYTGLYVCTYI